MRRDVGRLLADQDGARSGDGTAPDRPSPNEADPLVYPAGQPLGSRPLFTGGRAEHHLVSDAPGQRVEDRVVRARPHHPGVAHRPVTLHPEAKEHASFPETAVHVQSPVPRARLPGDLHRVRQDGTLQPLSLYVSSRFVNRLPGRDGTRFGHLRVSDARDSVDAHNQESGQRVVDAPAAGCEDAMIGGHACLPVENEFAPWTGVCGDPSRREVGYSRGVGGISSSVDFLSSGSPMFSLRVLGGIALDGPSGPVSGPATQPVRLSVLVLLAVPELRSVTRDKIVALLWPEQSAQRGRRNLSDALYVLRQELGDEAIRSSGDSLRLDPQRVGTDVDDFRRALERGEPREAIRAYGGPLLDGVHLRGSVEFERWVEARQKELARMYEEALASLARTADSTGDVEAAVRWRRKLVAERPYSTSAALALMRSLERAGDPAAAVRVAHLHEERLKEELGAEPDPNLHEELARIRTTPRSGDRPPSTNEAGTEAPTEASSRPAPAAAATARSEEGEEEDGRSAVWKRPVLLAVFLVGTALGSWALLSGTGGSPAAEPDPGRVAVFPFRVSGASPSLDYLREGMVDLLAAKLTGEVGPRAVDSRTSISAWRREGDTADEVDAERIRAVAAGLGAGRALLGEVVGSPQHLTISASLEPVDSRRPRITSQVEGPADSLTILVDRLVGQLLVEIAGSPGRTLESLTTPSLPALRAYLAGREAHRIGRHRRAIERFNAALDHDSAFALAAVALAEASFGIPGGSTGRHPYARRALSLARAARDRLSEEDRLYLAALSRPRYPASMFPWAEVIATWVSTVNRLIDKPEAWFQLGLHLAQFGPQTGRDGAQELAVNAFSRVLELDSASLPALDQLIRLEAREGDRGTLERLARLYSTRDPSGPGTGYVQWRIALELDDEEALAGLRSRFDELTSPSLVQIVGYGQMDGVGLADVRRAADILRERVRERRTWKGPYLRGTAVYLLKSYALNGGRPRQADSLLRVRWEGRRSWARFHHDRIYAALYEGGDTVGTETSVRRLEEGRKSPMPEGHDLEVAAEGAEVHPLDLCLAWQWRLWRGDTLGAEPAIRKIRAAEAARDAPCATVLELLLAAERGGDAARRARSTADEYVADGWHWPAGFMLNFAAARLYERLGDYEAAAAALRHRPYRPVTGTWTLGHSLHETGRLSLLAGDTARALSAYRHWLALHDDPEESRLEEVARVRDVVASLEAATGAPR